MDYKVKKDIDNQIKYLFLIDEYYDKLYEYTKDRNLKRDQSNIIKDLITICNKNNKINFINNLELPHDLYKLLNKYIILSEESGDNYTILTCYKFLLQFYKNPESEQQIELLCDIYERKRNITEEYDESYGDLIVNKKEDFMKAGEIYEQNAYSKVNKITKFSCEQLLFKAFLCYLNIDEILAEQKLNDFDTNFPIITNSMNYKLCRNIMQTYKEKDIDKFVEYIRDYDEIKRFDDFTINLLNNIKRHFLNEDNSLC